MYTSIVKAYCWSTEENILVRVKCCVSKSALDAVETPVASECIVGPCWETGDRLQALQNDMREEGDERSFSDYFRIHVHIESCILCAPVNVTQPTCRVGMHVCMHVWELKEKVRWALSTDHQTQLNGLH